MRTIWTSWCTFGGERWQTVVSQSAFLTVTNLSTLGTAALHQIILIGTPECISCNSFWIAFPFLTMHTSHWGQIGLALHWTLLHASEPVQGAFLAIWWSLLGFHCTAVEYQITPSMHPEPRDGGCIFTKWAEPGNATASGLNEKPPKCTISQQLPLLGLHAMISDSNKIVFILTVHAFEPSAAWQRQIRAAKIVGIHTRAANFPRMCTPEPRLRRQTLSWVTSVQSHCALWNKLCVMLSCFFKLCAMC